MKNLKSLIKAKNGKFPKKYPNNAFLVPNLRIFIFGFKDLFLF